MRIVFIGPPGAGKGTQAARLSRKLAVPHLSTGELLREAVQNRTEIGLKADQYMAAGRLAPDGLVLQMLLERFALEDCSCGFLLDGFPRTKVQAKSLDAHLAQCRQPLDLVIEIQAPAAEVIVRLAKRGRGDDEIPVIKKRLEVYAEQTHPLVDYYTKRGILRGVDGIGDLDEVHQRIVAAVQQAEAKRR